MPPSLQQILFIEDTEELLDIRCDATGLPLWPLVRNYYLREILSDLLYKNNIKSESSRSMSAKAIHMLVRGALHNLTRPAAASNGICVMASGMGLQQKEGLWFNRLSDHFTLAVPNATCAIEDRFDWTWPFPRHFSNVMLHAPYQVAGAVWGRMRANTHSRGQAKRLIELVDVRAQKHLGWSLQPTRRTMLIQSLAAKAAALPFMFSTYRKLFASTGAKLLLKEEACYGTSAIIVAAARSLGMITAEYQHGLISSGHDAYNFAPAVLENSAYRKCLPDYFLGYGQWWLEQINAPVTKIAVGNPHRETALADIDLTRLKSWVLVIGDGIDTEIFLDFAAKLAPHAKQVGLQVVFRPHPMERHLFESGMTFADVEIDTQREIYHSLARARAVVGEASTALFEASGLADMVFVWETPKSRFNLPSHPFIAIADAEQLACKLKNREQAALSNDSEAIWAKGWRLNYLEFLKHLKI